jgi:RNA polymerase sigma-70 factor (ECF subfamily)
MHTTRATLVEGGHADVLPVRDLDASYASFFREEFPRVVRTVALIVREQARAEDIAQETFLRLHQHWTRVEGYERPDAWVRRVAIRMALRGLRRDALWISVRSRLVPDHPEPSMPDPDLASAIARLPRSQRAAIVLHYYEDRPVAEIASLLGCTESTARVHLFHGRRRLAALLGEEAGDAPR